MVPVGLGVTVPAADWAVVVLAGVVVLVVGVVVAVVVVAVEVVVVVVVVEVVGGVHVHDVEELGDGVVELKSTEK